MTCMTSSRASKKPTKANVRKKASRAVKVPVPDRELVFVDEYLIDLNGQQAAIRAGYSADNARFQASRLLAREDIQARIAEKMAERSRRTGITADMVLERLWLIADADARELIELHRCCCRYCWGKGNQHQFTPQEWRDAQAEHAAAAAVALAEKKVIRPLSERGGTGFDPRKDPNPDCPECFGDGVERIVTKDTRDLSPAARRLYAGVKVTKGGLQVLTHDQKSALLDVGKHLGMFREKVELTGADGKPLAAAGVILIPAKGSATEAVSAVDDDQ